MLERDQVGVRELRQNLSVYLRRVQAGESLQVTARGRPVALLAPLREPASNWDRMVAEGRIVPARSSIEELPAPASAPEGRSISEILQELREDRI